MQRKNILFSTTRQWNPGDEFILKGIIHIFRSIDDNFNPIIFNRNPEIKHKESSRCFNFQLDMSRFRLKALKPGFYDNSFKRDLSSDNFIDLAVFAGTSEWASSRMRVLYEYIDKYSLPTIYLGIGVGGADFNFERLNIIYKKVMQKSKLIVVRDLVTQKALSSLKPVYLPCPAFLSAPAKFEKKITEVKKIGLIYGTDRSVKSNKVDQHTHRFMFGFYRKILELYRRQFDFQFICHYINELPEFLKDFPDSHCYYSYEPLDYLEIYNQFDLVIGPRVHGIGIAASQGIPGINLRHDVRSDTCQGFGAIPIGIDSNLDEAVSIFEASLKQISAINQNLLEEKRKTQESYLTLLKPVLAEI